MALHYKVIGTREPGAGKEGKQMWFPKLTGSRQMTLKEIAALISKRSTASPADVYLVIKSLMDVIPELLTSGYTLKFEELGTFRLHAKVEASDSPEKVTARNIKELRISFRPDKLVKDALLGVKVTPEKPE